MSFGERIKEFIVYKKMNVRSFEIESNLKNGAIFRVIKNNTSLNGASIEALGKAWGDLNMNWLMIGEGEMLKDSPIVNEPTNVYNDPTAASYSALENSLKRADEHIALQRDMIETLKEIIKSQKKEAKRLGIDL